MYGLSAAHRTLPFGTVVRVTRRDTGASVAVPVTDRGPFIRGRIVDLSYGAARRIDLHRDGLAPVVVEVVTGASPPPQRIPDAGPAPVYWVQVGAFGELDNARRSRRRLETMGEKAVVSEGPRGLLRVRSGPFASRREAEDALARVRSGWPEAQVVAGQAE
jgi:rare lipoprotein A